MFVCMISVCICVHVCVFVYVAHVVCDVCLCVFVYVRMFVWCVCPCLHMQSHSGWEGSLLRAGGRQS